ncbi:MAG: hypothetical protein IV100_01385 [Myxococcales bacterium]|nr:hypothetical protein [Myxococcales bacterium]
MAPTMAHLKACLVALSLAVGCASSPGEEAGSAVLVVTPDTIQFGVVLIGEPRVQVIHYGNPGERPVAVKGVNLFGSPEFSVIRWYEGSLDGCVTEGAAVTLPTTIAPGAGLCAELRFVPTSTAVASALMELQFGGDVALRSATRVVAFGQGTESHLEVVPAVLDFGTILVGQERTLAFALRSTRPEMVEVTGLTLESVVDWFQEDVALVPPSPGPVTIEPGQPAMKLASLRFSPSQALLSGKETLGFVVVEMGDEALRVAVRADVQQSHLDVQPEWVDFGDVIIGAPVSLRTVVFQNQGLLPIEISDLRIDQDWEGDFGFHEPPPALIVLEPGHHVSITIAIEIDDGLVGSLSLGMLRFGVTGAGAEPTRAVPLIATRSAVTYCALRLQPDELAYGAVEWGDRKVFATTLTNIGTAPCRLEALRVSTAPLDTLLEPPGYCTVPETWDPDPESRFVLEGAENFIDARLEPGETRVIAVAFEPGEQPSGYPDVLHWFGMVQVRARDLGGTGPNSPSNATILWPPVTSEEAWPCNLTGTGVAF